MEQMVKAKVKARAARNSLVGRVEANITNAIVRWEEQQQQRHSRQLGKVGTLDSNNFMDLQPKCGIRGCPKEKEKQAKARKQREKEAKAKELEQWTQCMAFRSLEL